MKKKSESSIRSPVPPSQLAIHFIDVGHGDATLIQLKEKNLLIDAGSSDYGEYVVKYLQNAGVTKLLLVIASHPDADHIGGMMDVLKAFPPDLYIDNGEENDKSSYEKLMKYLKKKEIPYTVGRTGMDVSFSEAISASIIHPSSLTGDMDENSICLLLTFGSLRFFFPGDSEICDADAEVVKLAHHGAKGAATRALLSETRPKTVIISVEKDKKEKIPAPSTLQALHDAGIEIRQTSDEGTIVLHSDGEKYWFV